MRTIFTTYDNEEIEKTVDDIAQNIASHFKFQYENFDLNNKEDINIEIEKKDAALFVIGISRNNSIQKYLTILREIRIPYLFVKEGQTFDLKEIILPITNVIEEKEKGPFASAFARFFNANIKIYKPKDYGTRAQNNIDAITSLFDSFSLKYNIIKGSKDSSWIELEAVRKENENKNNFALITASREYGLDDIIFGPKEKKIIKEAKIPVMLINPRGDLYALCE